VINITATKAQDHLKTGSLLDASASGFHHVIELIPCEVFASLHIAKEDNCIYQGC